MIGLLFLKLEPKSQLMQHPQFFNKNRLPVHPSTHRLRPGPGLTVPSCPAASQQHGVPATSMETFPWIAPKAAGSQQALFHLSAQTPRSAKGMQFKNQREAKENGLQSKDVICNDYHLNKTDTQPKARQGKYSLFPLSTVSFPVMHPPWWERESAPGPVPWPLERGKIAKNIIR